MTTTVDSPNQQPNSQKGSTYADLGAVESAANADTTSSQPDAAAQLALS